LGERDGLDCLLAIEDGTIIGVIVYEPCDQRGFGVVRSVGVAIEKQNHGIGTDLKAQVLDNCSLAGATAVLSEVHRENVKMQSVNKKLSISRTTDPENGKYYLYSARLVPDDDDDEGEADLGRPTTAIS
jgi:hypothetical protein